MGMKPSEKFPEETAFTPKYVMAGGNRLDWIKWKKQQTAQVADIYKDEEAYLSTKPKVSYFKGIINIKKGKGKPPYEMKDPFGKSTQGTYSKPYQILQRNVNKNHWTGATQNSHSFLLQADNKPPGEGTMKLMAYDLDGGPNHPKYIPPRGKRKAKKKTPPKIRFLMI